MSAPLVLSQRLVQQLSGLDFNRTRATGSQPATTEWTHLSLTAPEVSLVVNLSVEWLAKRPSYRLTTLLYAERALGHVRSFSSDECYMPPGGTAQRFGHSSLDLVGGAYRLRLQEPELALHAELELTPACKPSLTSNMPLGNGAALNWLVVPRLLASGTIRCAERTWRLSNAPAYRDRNWGGRIFSGEASWDWGYGIDDRAERPLALVIARLLDARRTRALQQNLFLWQGDELLALFRDHTLQISEHGSARFGPIPSFPRALALATPGHATGLPETLTVTAGSAAGALCARFQPSALARVLIPRRGKLGVSKLSEALGDYEVQGAVAGREIRMQTRGFFERVHA
jgi:hypothetical protein